MTENLDPETGFLEQLGQRVRTMRALRGMSAERYWQKFPNFRTLYRPARSGKGNVSIVLLRRVSMRWARISKTSFPQPEPSPDWPVIRDLVRKATPNQIAQAKDASRRSSNGAAPRPPRRMSFAGYRR